MRAAGGIGVATCCALTLLVASCGGRSTGQDRLIRDQGPNVLAEAEGRLEALPYPVSADARCWFDRLPSDILQVACGPLTISTDDLGANPGGPPYFYAMDLVDLGAPDVTRLRLATEQPFRAVLSFEDHPVELFRPDGEKLNPNSL